MDHNDDITAGWLSFRQLDQQQRWQKGESFRRFKQLAPDWLETRDFSVLHHQRDRALIDALRAKSLIYDSTVNLVLVSPEFASAIAGLKPGA